MAVVPSTHFSAAADTAASTRSVEPPPAPSAQWSLRARVVRLTACASLLAWLVGAAGALIAARQENEKLYDEHLREVGRAVLTFAGHHLQHIQLEGGTELVHWESRNTLDRRYAYQIWSRDGQLLLRSYGGPTTPFVPLAHRGFADHTIDGQEFRVFAAASPDGAQFVQVAEQESLRKRFMPGFSGFLAAFFLVSLVLLVLFTRWGSVRATRALEQSARQLKDRSPHDLREVSVDAPPSELEPLLRGLNALFHRIHRTLDAERSFASSAAHELRTPLAAIRMHAQVAERARTRQEALGALKAMQQCVDRAAHTIEQLLTLARVEVAALHAQTMGPVRLDALVRNVVEDLSPLLRASGTRLELALEEAQLFAVEFGVAALVRNLIDNAVRHSPAGGQVRVTTQARGQAVWLVVEDDGPGVDEADRERIFERFYRLPESGADGCGVGLSIVRCVADVHRARIELDRAALGGLRVAIIFERQDEARAP
jgi:signal transduction histidine kinase